MKRASLTLVKADLRLRAASELPILATHGFATQIITSRCSKCAGERVSFQMKGFDGDSISIAVRLG